MKSKLFRAFTIGAITVGVATMTHAQQRDPAGQRFDRGKYEYDAHCAACHGLSGKGGGHFVQLLKSGTVVPDLTALSKKNNGVFPFARVYDTIDGTQSVSAHGTKEMPIWGTRYKIEAGERIYDDFRADPEPFVRARILALTEYVYRLQTK